MFGIKKQNNIKIQNDIEILGKYLAQKHIDMIITCCGLEVNMKVMKKKSYSNKIYKN